MYMKIGAMVLFYVIGLAWVGFLIWVFSLLIRALLKYLKTEDVRKGKNEVKRTLGEKLKNYRISCNMTQEFVAESLGISRQAVSKWEMGVSEPSTSNLLALAKLYDVTVEEILRDVEIKFNEK